ncbi:MAG: hypothetical protein GWM90_10020, partial [Gemmatimonadetes bacterium]|nr:hypothetical protein [Gemmatimonadota bacterium]NIR40143.1 hypothetical protein [Actinomycetota bacterium]NIU74472.1 hypothetical protein [Gammaproteobacteria bacterium]NIQ54265.1 hypothetical protein [Gemmatimonadota bacterium]NIX44439.1 hypothetical protein [Gemmatimonadota bacterium]
GDRVYPRFVENLRSLPVGERTVLIRSYFNRFRSIPETVPGYISTQLLQGVPALLDDWEADRIRGYDDLVPGLGGR